ncbi:hypothetical protein BY996DRAFT_6413063 [Phakopsora pachyrhizi]|nr:hypothetical protein BY996DRAFT_6413063 [Phakopsora pachyrhizi]
MISSILASMTMAHLKSVKDQDSCNKEEVTEDKTTPMLPENMKSNLKYVQVSAQLSGIIDFTWDTTLGVLAYFPVYCLLDSPDSPKDEIKKGCHAAFVLASTVSGTVEIQFTARDSSGAITGVYSLCGGGLGILIGSFGGILADWALSAPFYLSGVLTMIIGLVCGIIFIGD